MSHNSNQPLTADHEWNMSELTFLLLIEAFVKLYMFSRHSSLLTTVCDGSRVLYLPAGVCMLMYSIPSLGSSLEPTCMPLQVLQSHICYQKTGKIVRDLERLFFKIEWKPEGFYLFLTSISFIIATEDKIIPTIWTMFDFPRLWMRFPSSSSS